MTIDVDGLQSFTASDLLKLTEYAIAHLLAGGQSYTIGNRSFSRADLEELRANRAALKREVQEAGSNTGSLTALGNLKRAT